MHSSKWLVHRPQCCISTLHDKRISGPPRVCCASPMQIVRGKTKELTVPTISSISYYLLRHYHDHHHQQQQHHDYDGSGTTTITTTTTAAETTTTRAVVRACSAMPDWVKQRYRSWRRRELGLRVLTGMRARGTASALV